MKKAKYYIKPRISPMGYTIYCICVRKRFLGIPYYKCVGEDYTLEQAGEKINKLKIMDKINKSLCNEK